ncbi:MAG: DUF3098 domain-containing protein [Candidatus Marinimicrobia bacterium]|nr:DUF3098 domain-containing protein [Candidatus Neomarinimicrobiota bacterium]
MAKVKKNTNKRKPFIERLTLTNTNFLIFGVGLLVILLGYIIMASGDTYSFRTLTVAPIVLLIGYLIIVPLAILYKKRKNDNKNS